MTHFLAGIDNPKNPPLFNGGANAWHFARCQNLTVRHLRISGQSGNGLNLDDGGLFDEPVTGITLEHLQISDIGPKGNHDGIKRSGLDKLTIRDCSLTGWGNHWFADDRPQASKPQLPSEETGGTYGVDPR